MTAGQFCRVLFILASFSDIDLSYRAISPNADNLSAKIFSLYSVQSVIITGLNKYIRGIKPKYVILFVSFGNHFQIVKLIK
jgi:hypothetical protein